MANVPTNLIPSRITSLPEAPVADPAGYFPIVISGTTYKVQFSQIQGNVEVPASRQIIAGTGLTGGGTLSQNITIAVANGGIGNDQLDTTGVAAGSYGTGSLIPVVTVNTKGRVTSISTTSVIVTGYVSDTIQVVAGTGLTGGGTLTQNRTLAIDYSATIPSALGTASAGSANTPARADHVHPAVDLSDSTQTTGTLPLGRGGTGAALSPVAGGIAYSTGSQFALGSPGSVGQVLVSGGTGAYTWGSVQLLTPVAANSVFAGPTSGGNADPSFRALVNADIPTTLNGKTIESATITNALSLTAVSGNITTLTSSSGTITNLTGTSGTIDTLAGTSWTVTNLTATSATISNFTFTSSTVTDLTATRLTATSAHITTLSSGSATLTNLTSTSGTISTLKSTSADITNLAVSSLTVSSLSLSNATFTSATITTLTGTSAGITTISTGSLTATNLTATSGTVSTLTSTSAGITNLSVSSLTVSSLSLSNATFTSATITTLTGTSANITTLTGTTFGTTATTQLRGASGQIGQLNSTSATITTLTSTSAGITNLSVSSLTVSSLSLSNATFTSATITTLNSTSATIANLNSTSANITTLTGTTFGTTATTQLRGASGQITNLAATTATISSVVLVATATNTNSSAIATSGTISEGVGGVQYLVASQYDIGTDPNEIPLNQYLGTMAYQDSAAITVGDIIMTGSLTGTVAGGSY